ncbi:unnamed protein product [Rotaria sp. Silwood1]|nr:unnamed protein product [Rotaria sp. Silwood1]
MASSTTDSSAPNLATLLLIKRKLGAKNSDKISEKQASPTLQTTTIAHSNEKSFYRQNMSIVNPTTTTTTTTPTNIQESPKVSRKNKQIEVELLDKKMEEINRKQEVKTNETLVTWKGFDSLNYGFVLDSNMHKSTPFPPTPTKQRTPTPSINIQSASVKNSEKTIIETRKQESPVSLPPIEKYPSTISKQSTPQLIDSSVKDQSSSKLSLKEDEPQKFEQASLPISNNHNFKLFPDIKHNEIRTRNAYKSIQRSMDRYRFHVW